MSTCDIVYVVDWSAFRRSWASTYDVAAFGVSKLSVSVLVYVVVWFAFSANVVSICVIVYVVALFLSVLELLSCLLCCSSGVAVRQHMLLWPLGLADCQTLRWCIW